MEVGTSSQSTLLRGLLREDRGKWFPGTGKVEPEIRAEIEKRIMEHECIPTTVEVLKHRITFTCRKNRTPGAHRAKTALLVRIAHTLAVCARNTTKLERKRYSALATKV
jgi:hypothetical protein